MEGCSAPLVVKFADTHKDKEQKKIQQIQATFLSSLIGSATTTATGLNLTGLVSSSGTSNLGAVNGSGSTGAGAANSIAPSPSGLGVSLVNAAAAAAAPSSNSGQNATALTSNAPLLSNPPQPVNPFVGADAITTSPLQLLQQLQAVGLQQQYLQGSQLYIHSTFHPSPSFAQKFNSINYFRGEYFLTRNYVRFVFGKFNFSEICI